jgi:hypothetical protein
MILAVEHVRGQNPIPTTLTLIQLKVSLKRSEALRVWSHRKMSFLHIFPTNVATFFSAIWQRNKKTKSNFKSCKAAVYRDMNLVELSDPDRCW